MTDEATVRRSVKLPGGNQWTVGQLRALLADASIPDSARVRTMRRSLDEADVTLWWDEVQR